MGIRGSPTREIYFSECTIPADRIDSNAQALLNLFPARASDFTGLMTAMGYDPNDTTTDPTSPAGVGNRAGQRR